MFGAGEEQRQEERSRNADGEKGVEAEEGTEGNVTEGHEAYRL